MAAMLAAVRGLVRPSRLLITTNLDLNGGFRRALAGDAAFSTRFLDRDTAVSVLT